MPSPAAAAQHKEAAEAFAGKSTADSVDLYCQKTKAKTTCNRYVFDIWRQPNVSGVEEINKKGGG
jgi:hypothetical protein